MKRRGFTLLEGLVAIVLLAIVVTGVVPMFLGAKTSHVASYAVEQGSQFAESKIDSLRMLGRHTLGLIESGNGAWSATNTTTLGTKDATWKWKMDTVSGTVGQAGIVTVQVSWQQGNATNQVTLQGEVR